VGRADRRVGDVECDSARGVEAIARAGDVDGAAVGGGESGRRRGVDVEAAGERNDGAVGVLVVVVEVDAGAAVVDGAGETDDAAADAVGAGIRHLDRAAGAGPGNVGGAVGRNGRRNADVGRGQVDVDAARRDARDGAAQHVDAGR